MKQLIYWLAKYSGIFSVCRWITRKDLRILAYHGIWMGDGHFGNFLYMSPAKFARRMQQLKSLGFPVLALSEALTKMQHDSLPDGAVVLTIDDGWYSTYLHMLPVLEKYDFPATLYVTTYYSEHQFPVFSVLVKYLFSRTDATRIDLAKLGITQGGDITLANELEKDLAKSKILTFAASLPNEELRQNLAIQVGLALAVDCKTLIEEKIFHLVTPEQVQALDQSGIDIQLHTHRHTVYQDGRHCLEKELQDNRNALEKITSRTLEHFCYPSGVYEKCLWPTLNAAEVCSATTTEVGLVQSSSNKYALPRILDGEQVSDLEFEAELCGFVDLKRRLVQFIRG